MTSRKKWTIAGVLLLGLCGLVFALQGELSIVIANRRPDLEAARLARELRIDGDETVAEIGAGKGWLTVEMARLLPRGRMYSTELGQEKLDDIRRASSDARLRNIEVREAAVAGTNLPDACCDAIFMRTVYHHFQDPAVMVPALYKALKPGGRVAIIEFEPRGIWRFLEVPDDVPDRGGHGVPKALLVREVTGGGFRHEQTVDNWAGSLYLMTFQR
jgi:ubiquinone/menaquinone biosynthesis C-methylase UbiE